MVQLNFGSKWILEANQIPRKIRIISAPEKYIDIIWCCSNSISIFKYQESNIKISRSYRPPSYSSNVWGEVRVGYSSPFGKWIVYRNSKKDYELDFRLAEKYGSSIEFAIRNNFDESETVTSSEALEITKCKSFVWVVFICVMFTAKSI